MPKQNKSSDKKRIRPQLSPEAQENRMISLAMDAAEQQLIDGTASAQVITHFLKLGSEKAKLERAVLEKQAALISAKTKAYESAEDSDRIYQEAIDAMMRYNGEHDD